MLIIKWGSYHLPMTCLLHFCKLSKTYVDRNVDLISGYPTENVTKEGRTDETTGGRTDGRGPKFEIQKLQV